MCLLNFPLSSPAASNTRSKSISCFLTIRWCVLVTSSVGTSTLPFINLELRGPGLFNLIVRFLFLFFPAEERRRSSLSRDPATRLPRLRELVKKNIRTRFSYAASERFYFFPPIFSPRDLIKLSVCVTPVYLDINSFSSFSFYLFISRWSRCYRSAALASRRRVGGFMIRPHPLSIL